MRINIAKATFDGLIVAIIGFGIYEIVYGFVQLYEFLTSVNCDYKITGSFYNQGPYCAYIGCIVPLAFDAVVSHRCKFLRYIGLLYLILSVILMPMLLGRTGWVAAAVGSGVVWMREKSKSFRPQFYYLIVLISLIIAVMAFLYVLKPNSALGRIFLWRIGFDAWMDNFWNGVGWDKVAGAIGNAQERYFTTHPDSVFASVAGCPEFAFNEYLQIAIAFGVVGLAIFIVIFSMGIMLSLKSRQNGVLGVWVAFGIVCLASYPLQFAEFRWLIIAFTMLTLLGYQRMNISNEFRNEYRYANIIILLQVIVISIVGFVITYDVSSPREKSRFYFDKGMVLRLRHKFIESNIVLEQGMEFSSDPMFLNLLGRNMQDMGEYTDAERYFLRSLNRLPSRLYPRYLLGKLYASPEYYSPSKFKDIYDDAMNLMIKVNSPAICDMNRELQRLNDSIQRDGVLLFNRNN